tara:strand:+ start:465 stop:1184 length:720 start_codon:yes stop_codon:yes gene_type:complete
MHYSNLQDILVLGSSRGLGKSLYKLFQSDGFKVIGVSRSKSNQSDFICDLSNKHEVKNLVDTLYNSGNIAKNIIFNAGQGSSNKKSIEERKEELMQQNLHTSTNFVEELKKIPKILEIVESFTFINSICALKNFKCSDEYEQSKFELLKYSRDLAEDFVRYRIRINSILPGNIMHEDSVWRKKFKNEMEEKIFLKKTMPSGSWIYPEHVFSSIKYLIQNENVINTEIILDGGQSLFSPD